MAYMAPSSLPLSAGLSVIASNVRTAVCLNPFHIDFHRILHLLRVVDAPQDASALNDPRLHAYLMFALYRLLRALIPTHAAAQAVAADAQQLEQEQRPATEHQHADEEMSPSPPVSPPPPALELSVMIGRVSELFTGRLVREAQNNCVRASGGEARSVFTTADIRALLQLDAAADETALSPCQRWLITDPVWQRQATATVELMAADLWQAQYCRHTLSSRYLGEPIVPREPWSIATLHAQVIGDGGNAELTALWRIIGMPADCPPGVDIPYQVAYKEQFRRQMEAAALASAPWMADRRQVAERVEQWRRGRLSDGDATFFQRFHIRPVRHSGVKLPPVFGQREAHPRAARGIASDDDWDSDSYQPRPWLMAAFDIVDAAGVSWPFLIRCLEETVMNDPPSAYVSPNVKLATRDNGRPLPPPAALRPLFHTSNVCAALSWPERTSMSIIAPNELYWDHSQLPSSDGKRWHPTLSDYVCHGHMHGLSAEEWKEAMGGEVTLRYEEPTCFRERTFDVDSLVTSSDQQPTKKRKGAAIDPRAALFPLKLSEVTNQERYGQMQRTEIRRLACVATRLLLMNSNVDAAVFREHQPQEVRRQFNLARQSAAEQLVLSQSLPSDVQGIVAQYEPFEVDIPV